MEQLHAWVAKLQAAEEFAFDTETDSLDPMRADLVGISLCVEPGTACYIPLTHRSGTDDLFGTSQLAPGQLPLDDLLQQYQRGTELLRFCQSKLEAVEQQIQVFENGEGRPWAGGA